jgi:hypothetical protein
MALALPAICAIATLASEASAGGAAERPEPLPEFDAGIAARYPGDVGLAGDGDVLFVEDFEQAALEDVFSRWTSVSNKDGAAIRFSGDVPASSPGRQSLEMTATRGVNVGGHLWKRFEPGVDRMFARAYVRFSRDHPYVHHLLRMGAWRDSPPWPRGEAGYRHDGTRSFQTGVEPGSGWGRHMPPGAWYMYTYWCEMKSYRGPTGNIFYGNAFLPETREQVPRGEWQCVELMLKANSAPERHDGEQAFWVDGRLAGRWAPGEPNGRWEKDNYLIDEGGRPFEGFRWRLRDDLKINTFWLLYYMRGVFDRRSQFVPPKDVPYNADMGRVWFDHVVVATEYIGPIKRAADARDPDRPPVSER